MAAMLVIFEQTNCLFQLFLFKYVLTLICIIATDQTRHVLAIEEAFGAKLYKQHLYFGGLTFGTQSQSMPVFC